MISNAMGIVQWSDRLNIIYFFINEWYMELGRGGIYYATDS